MPAALEWILTDDGSPSLIEHSAGRAEAMHSRAGAFSESLAIYDRATAFVLRQSWPGHFLSVGLGLGYNEMILAARYLRHGADDLLTLNSLESSEILSRHMTDWLAGTLNCPDWQQAYEAIATRAEMHFRQPPGSVRRFLSELYRQDRWTISGALTRNSDFRQPASAIFYDAYSSKTCPELWENGLLAHLLADGAAEQCVFTTYALTGTLKRALTAAGFERQQMPGFAGKRHSAFAVRGAYSNSIER